MLNKKTKARFHTSISSSLLCLFLVVALTLTLAGCAKEIQVLPVDEFRFTQQQVRKAVLSEDAHLAAFIFEDASVSVWDINEKRERYNWHAKALDESSLHLISFSKNKAWMALTGHWSTTLIDLRSGEVIGTWYFSVIDPGATASSTALSALGDSALVSMTDGTVLQLNFDNGTALQYQHNTMKVLHVGYASGEELASWEIKRFSSEATTHAITLNNDGDVVTLSSDGVLQSWDYRSLITHQ